MRRQQTPAQDRRVAFDDLGGVGYVSTIRVTQNVFETAGRIGPAYDVDVIRRTTTYPDALAAHYGLVHEHRELMNQRRRGLK